MKRFTALAATAALTLATLAAPLHTFAAAPKGGVIVKTIRLEDCFQGEWFPNLPESPEDKPEAEAPETKPEDKPESEAPETVTQAEQILRLVNQERAKAGLAPVTLDKNMGAAALVRAKEIVSNFSHTRPNGTGFATALKEQGVSYRGAGENIAWGQRTAEAVMEAWMSSPGHRANILDAKYTKLGVGHYQNAQGTNYWVQLFTY